MAGEAAGAGDLMDVVHTSIEVQPGATSFPDPYDVNNDGLVSALDALLVITVSFAPVFTLEAQEGRLFKPLAFTKTFAMASAALLAVTLVFRYEVIEILNHSQLRFRTHGAAFFFVLGWLVHRSRTHRQRAATCAIAAVTIVGFFDRPQRELFIVGCLVALVWFREITVPRLAVAPIALVSTSSLWIFITHFTVWPPLVRLLGRDAAYPIVIAAGVGAWLVARAMGEAARRVRAWRADHAVVTDRPGIVRMA